MKTVFMCLCQIKGAQHTLADCIELKKKVIIITHSGDVVVSEVILVSELGVLVGDVIGCLSCQLGLDGASYMDVLPHKLHAHDAVPAETKST